MNKKKLLYKKKLGIGGDIGAGVAGVAKGVLGTVLPGPLGGLAMQGVDTIHSGLDDDITSQEKSIAGYGQAVGAAGAAVATGGVAAPQALSVGAQGLGQGIAAGSPESREAQLIGQGLNITGQIGGYAMGRPTVPTTFSQGGLMMGAKQLPGMENTNVLGFAMGGNTQLSEINNGGTHEQNPNGGVPMGQTASVEQGETKWEDYIFSDRIKVPGAKHTFADESKKIQKKYPKERENDIPTQKAKEKEMKRLMAAQEVIRTEMGVNNDIQMANGGRVKFPDGGTISTGVDSLGRAVYPNDKVSDKAKKYFAENPSMFNAIGAPKMETTIDTNKEAIIKSLNNSKTVSKTPSSIPAPALKWLDEPGVTGWQQAYDPSKKKTAYRPVTKGVDGKPKYGPIEYKMGGSLDLIPEVDNSGIRLQDILTPSDLSSLSQLGSQLRHDPLYPSIRDREIGLPTKIPLEEPLRGSIMRSSNQGMTSFSPKRAYGGRIKAANGIKDVNGLDLIPEIDYSGLRAQDFNQRQFNRNPDAFEVTDPLAQGLVEEQAVRAADAENLQRNIIVPQEIATQTSKFAPEGNGVLARPLNNNSNLGIMNPSIGASAVTADTFNPLAGMNNGKAAGQGVLQNPPQPTNLESGYTTNTGLGNTKQKGTSGFDKYDAITMGAQLLPAMYNIGQGLRKQKPVDLGRMTPNLVDYSASRKASEDSFNQQANILNESIRENATSSGQALSNRVAFANRAALDKANQLGQINEREYNTNQQIRGNADLVNLQIRANEEQIDAQNKGISQTSVGMGLAQIGQAAGTINRDRNLKNTEEETIDMLGDGTDFTYVYDPKLGRRKRVYRGSLNTKNTQV